ncbi:S-methyl-5-thioribose-1-phosphate isomerase [Rubinisphaera brasiliensis]|uniref:Methylthioribose-1-phosphate isomerase n=1 Tax=Rubinisphaera brasiliensis (strain ATCC 49424 / DSM 5305 / JCM 21570 / IAM 15109 / NBRC 103401 / IFAM 1448) TaxID=756272 RepID=F0SMJ6_RUBBR|nr:S-methyl-5-thioribose-1-phosphate isomerase [Rubinisphaera brasiliensis]ADY57758.1 Methylthioribose-1-phosphate isomerase [Rubinisphaera brasiliensis DSM 5305]
MIKTIEWIGEADGHLRLLDQTALPTETVFLDCETPEQVYAAIQRLSVRGAPAIGVSAAYGVLTGLREAKSQDRAAFDAALDKVCTYLAESRPTAVNLFWALDRMRRVAGEQTGAEPLAVRNRLLEEARAIEIEDREMCAAMGRFGAELINQGDGVLTHCNTGALATAGDGTALAVIFAAHEAGKGIHVYADETRPLLQGARLTAWELQQRGVPSTLICDSMAAWVMKEGRVQAVITGSDRIAANGDAANKIGTYGLSVLAKAHNIPFYVAAPSSTFDMTLESGDSIPIEQRKSIEITNGFGKQTAPDNCQTYNPAFDVAPAENITALITEKGVIQPVTTENVKKVLGSAVNSSTSETASDSGASERNESNQKTEDAKETTEGKTTNGKNIGPLLLACQRNTFWQANGDQLTSTAITILGAPIILALMVSGLCASVFGLEKPLYNNPIAWTINGVVFVSFWVVFWMIAKRQFARNLLHLHEHGIQYNGLKIAFDEIRELRIRHFETVFHRILPSLMKISDKYHRRVANEAKQTSATLYLSSNRVVVMKHVLRIFNREHLVRVFGTIKERLHKAHSDRD